MGSSLIVILEEDKNYIFPLLEKIIRQYGQDIELAVFTEKENFAVYLEKHFQIDVLVVSEEITVKTPAECHIAHRIILTERFAETQSTGDKDGTVFFYRYSPLDLLVHVISSYCASAMQNRKETGKTTVILVSSAAGGTGKTVIAMALAMSLRRAGKNALYLDAEWLQNFTCYLERGETMEQNKEREFARSDGKDTELLTVMTRTEKSLLYVPQFETPIVFLDKTLSLYINCIKALKQDAVYDYIVVDTDETMDLFKIQLMGLCEQMVVVTSEQQAAEYATGQVLKQLNMPKKNIHVIKNKASAENKGIAACSYRDYIGDFTALGTLEASEKEMADTIAAQSEIQKLAFMLM